MPVGATSSIALIVQDPPYRARVARSDVDIALAAAALDFNIRVYFQGFSVMQLAARRNASDALLPNGYRAWAALPDLADALFFAERKWVDRCRAGQLELVLPVEPLDEVEMKRSWRSCDHVLVL